MKKLLLTLLIFPGMLFAQNDMPQIARALSNGDANAVGAYFDTSIELSILDNEGVYNSGQARQQLARFLSQNKPSSFVEVHQGASRSSDSKYVIGNLSTNNGTFRVYLYLSNKNGKMVIQELRFDRE